MPTLEQATQKGPPNASPAVQTSGPLPPAREYTSVSKFWKKSLSSALLKDLIGCECSSLEEIGLLRCRLGGRLEATQEARGKVRGTILGPGAWIAYMARL